MTEFPKSIKTIRARLQNFGTIDAGRKEKIIANIILSQMLPASAVRGGTGLKIRFGDYQTRGSKDLDVALTQDIDEFILEFGDNLSLGWNGFTGQLIKSKKISHPKDIPRTYVTVTWDVKLFFNGYEWVRQEIDLGHEEIGDVDEIDLEMSDEILLWFDAVGVPRPEAIPVIKIHHQIAQKLHALISNPSERIHDLVDLQVIFSRQEIVREKTNETCKRLFNSRNTITWPSKLAFNLDDESLYINAIEQTGSISDLESAVNWINEKINWLNQN